MTYAHEVMVLAKGAHPETLTYFGSEAIAPFTRVMVPLRKKETRGIVVSSQPISHVKGEVKASDFALRKISSVVGAPLFREGYIDILKKIALFYAVPLGSLILKCIPVELFDLAYDSIEQETPATESSPFRTERMLLASPLHERISYYKTLIRESFAREQSLFITVPTVQDADVLYSHLEHGIEKYVFAFHSEKTPAKVRKDLRSVLASKHPVVVIATAPYLALPLSHIRTIILEHETSQSYMTIGASPIDLKRIAYLVSEMNKIPLFVADTYPSVEAYAMKESGELETSRSFSLRLPEEKKLTVIDMKHVDQGGAVIIGETLLARMRELEKQKKNIFLFTLRDGLGSQVLCQDCGDTIKCRTCEGVLSLKLESGKNVLWCKDCRRSYPSDIVCTRCGSWKLKELGVGIDVLYKEVKRLFPQGKILVLGKKKPADDMKDLEAHMSKRESAIILGTPRALSLIPKEVPLVAVVSFDSLLYYPHFAIAERILTLTASLFDLAHDEFLIQTRNNTFPLLAHLEKNSLNDWYKEELALRKRFDFPPYTNILELRYNMRAIPDKDALEQRLTRVFAPYQLHMLERRTKGEISVVVKLPRSFYDLEHAGAHPLSSLLEKERMAGAAVIWNSLSL